MKLNFILRNFCLLFFVIVVASKKQKAQTTATNTKPVPAVSRNGNSL